jgi:hypothetical protein
VTTTSICRPETIDPVRWPDVAVAVGSPGRAAVARALFGTAIIKLPVRVRLPDGTFHGAGGPAAPVMDLHRPAEFFRRLGASGLIGFGESYMAGDWDSPDLTGLLTVFAAHAAELVPPWLQRLRRLAGRVSVELRDYRDVDGRFDAICSVEMLEAVGERYWDAYFAALDRHLAPGGRIGLQTITMPHDRMLATRHTYTWIQKYVFPGGLLPSVAAIGDSLARTTLRITGREDFGAHYAETLRIWRERFGAQAARVACLGFDEVFSRMWTFYLCYSEAGFRAGYIDVSQLTLARI